jgi:hypothetical protein
MTRSNNQKCDERNQVQNTIHEISLEAVLEIGVKRACYLDRQALTKRLCNDP